MASDFGAGRGATDTKVEPLVSKRVGEAPNGLLSVGYCPGRRYLIFNDLASVCNVIGMCLCTVSRPG